MKIYNKILVIAAILFTGFAGCKKSEIGFLSENVFYRSNPIVAEQGAVTYSSPLEVDGSTAPIKVKLVDVRDKATGKSVIDSFLKEREITTFLGEITSSDTSLEMINKKLTKKMVKPFNVAEIGGRLEFSAATKHLAAGTYEIDIEINNVKGSRVLKNVCDIVLKPLTDPYTVYYRRIQTSEPGLDNPQTFITDNAGGFPIDINYISSSENKIILKWVDKNGNPFNPKTDIRRNSETFPVFSDWDPFFPQITTDSTMEFQFPSTGLSFPVFKVLPIVGGAPAAWDNGICYYRILAGSNDINKTLRLTHAIRYNADGIYNVTFHLNLVNKK